MAGARTTESTRATTEPSTSSPTPACTRRCRSSTDSESPRLERHLAPDGVQHAPACERHVGEGVVDAFELVDTRERHGRSVAQVGRTARQPPGSEPAALETAGQRPRICYGILPMLPAELPRRSLPVLGAAAPRIEPRTVRVSLTDRCDLACVYCRPSRSDGYLEKRLGDEAWRAMVQALVHKGVRRVRITGGEPLLHPRVTELVAYVASLGVEDLALTTNATRLEKLARPLRAGRAAKAHRLARLARARALLAHHPRRQARSGPRRHRGRARAPASRSSSSTRSCSATRTTTSCPRWSSGRGPSGIVPRFIEVMRVGEGANLPASKLVGHDEMRRRLAPLLVDDAGARDPHRGPARYVPSRRDPRLRVGFITGTTDTYCSTCDRLRVASDGTLRPCLATNDGVAAMDLAQRGDVDGLVRAIGEAWDAQARRPDVEGLHRGHRGRCLDARHRRLKRRSSSRRTRARPRRAAVRRRRG